MTESDPVTLMRREIFCFLIRNHTEWGAVMKTAAKIVFAMVVSVCYAAGPMNNDDVIKLFKAGINEALILSTIDSSEPQFDTTVDGLINLKKARC